LTRLSVRLFGMPALAVFIASAISAVAQQHVPPAPDAGAPAAQQPADQAGPAAAEPSAPAPTAPAFPKPNPADFNAASPTKEVVDGFLRANWGYDDNRVWQVQAILKTPVEGLSKVIVLIADRGGKQQQPQGLSFFVLPDGKHLIAGDQVIDFGDHPFADVREKMEQRADGPYRGTAAKDFEMVEFADFQCPHCKEAQANMEKLVTDFPKARIVFQNWPISSIHPEATTAAEYGVCVNKQGGSTAFFQYADAVFEGQDGLATPDGATLTLNSAVTKAGLDPAKIATCAATPDIKALVDASVKLGSEVGVGQVPTLVVNGREIPANAPYDQLKKIIQYQAKLDGIAE
jgi:protein-disulfide isomerase